MKRAELVQTIRNKKSCLCVGLDPDLDKMPSHIRNLADPIFEFNKVIIESTKEYCVAYKANTAFYEAYGVEGWRSLEKTLKIIPNSHFKIADAKRGDIGNTSSRYAEAFFQTLEFDAITVAPYMGRDSVQPFLGYEGKWVILLVLTSNKGSQDFQRLISEKKPVYKHVLATSAKWGSADNMMYVVGATHPDDLYEIRKMFPAHFLLIPGVGSQGGDLESVIKAGMNEEIGMLINVSRAISYASSDEDFGKAAGLKAKSYQTEMSKWL
jgi:orotidine-5'-phosphate decarboxylase